MSAGAGRPGHSTGEHDEQALEQAYRVEAPRLARYFRKRGRSEQDALDLVHDTFARLIGSVPGSPVRRHGAYLQKIARNLLTDRARRAAPEHVCLEEAGDLSVPASQALAAEAADTMSIYRRALSELPEKTQQVFMLHRLDDLTYREIAERLGISVPTVQYHFARALVHIDSALDRG